MFKKNKVLKVLDDVIKEDKTNSDNTQRYYGEQISENRIRTPEGYLICLDVPIAASEPMEYSNESVGLNTDSPTVMITNPWEELSCPCTIASFEAKPVTLHHPDSELLDANTAPDEIVGVCVNVRADGINKVLIADLVIIDNEAITAVLSGIKEVSCGYTASVVDNGDGTGYRIGIIGNHVAIVPAGRCGATCSISDSKEKKVDKKTILETLKSWVKDAEEPAKKEDDFDAKAAIEALSKQVAELTAKLNSDAGEPEAAPAAAEDKLSQVLELLQKLLEIENAKSVSDDDDDDEDSDEDDDDDDSVNDAKNVKIVMPTVNDGADVSAMTPAKLNAVAEQFYKRGK